MALDGLRGVAAMAVVVFHRRWWFDDGVLDRGFLAVDFFFILSGFVIAHAYEQRLRDGRLSLRDFARARIVRLWPLVIVGAVLGTIALVEHAIEQRWLGGVLKALLAFPLAMILLPTPPILQPQPFSTNQPSWSLTFEILVNMIYAAVARHLTDRVLAAILFVSGLLLLCVALTPGYGMGVGWRWTTMLPAVPRVVFPFFLGVQIRRWHLARKLPRLGLPTWILALLLLAILAVPPLSGGAERAFELLAVFVIFPAIVMSGSLQEPKGRWMPIAAFSAELSYPIYILHLPILDLIDAPAMQMPGGAAIRLLVCVAIVTVLSLVAGRWIDLPLRRWLRARFITSPSR